MHAADCCILSPALLLRLLCQQGSEDSAVCRMQIEMMSSCPSIPRKGLTVHALQGPQAAADLAALLACQSIQAVPPQLLTALMGSVPTCMPAVDAGSALPSDPAAALPAGSSTDAAMPDSSPATDVPEICANLNEEQAQALSGIERWFTGQQVRLLPAH